MSNEYKAKLLIVDDLQENLHALAKIIEKDDRLIYLANSGEEALSLLLEHEFALAILDVMMPEMNGFELAELMRSTEKTRHIPIVFVSATGKELNYAFKGYETGAVDFLQKPLDILAVKSKVDVFVSLYKQHTEIKQKMTELEKSRAELHVTKNELEYALKMRDDFMSLVGHELRTPLNTLHIETQLRQLQLKKGDMSAFTADKLEAMIARDDRQIQSMIRLISDLNDVSRIQNGKLSIRTAETNLSELIQQIVKNLSWQADNAGVTFTLNIQDDVTGMWDELRIEQIIINLLTNALRYGNNKPVEITLQSTLADVTFSVRDHGIGIPISAQKRIFEKFERAETKRVNDGLGMGLYIARQLAEAHHGTLNVKSTVGEGATFTLTLPRQTP